MKKITDKALNWLAMAVVGLLGLALFSMVAHAQTAFNTNLYYGLINNNDVQALQEFLTEQGDYSGPITGNFYSLTLKGVKTFQAANGLPSTGYFGVLSRGVANSIFTVLAPTPSKEEIGTSTPDIVASSTPVQSQVASTSSELPPIPAGSVPLFVTPSGAIVDANGNTTQVPQAQIQTPAPSVPQVLAPAPAPVTPPDPPYCTLSATAVQWPQGSTHALFSWFYTVDATATIDASPLWRAAQVPASITNGHSENEDSVYGPTIFPGNSYTYTMTVTRSGLTTTCSTTVSL